MSAGTDDTGISGVWNCAHCRGTVRSKIKLFSFRPGIDYDFTGNTKFFLYGNFIIFRYAIYKRHLSDAEYIICYNEPGMRDYLSDSISARIGFQNVAQIFPLTPAVTLFRNVVIGHENLISNHLLIVQILVLSGIYLVLGMIWYQSMERKLVESIFG